MFKRVNSDVVPFSINSPAGNRYAFGTTDVSNDIDVNYNENIKKGFGTGPNEFPELEDFNALMFTGSYLAAYLYQAGIPEWNDKQKYYINSIAMGSDGNLYKSLTGTEETPNVDNNPTLAGSVSWKSILSDYALKNGSNQNLFKVKDAEEDDEAVNKKQLDDTENISSLSTKTTPVDTDNLKIQESGGLFKKLSWANLKATLFDGAMSLTVNGYIKLPSIMGGTIFQWGNTSFTFTGAGVLSNTVTFPIAFTAQIYAVLPSLVSNAPDKFNSSYGSLSLASFTFYCSSSGTSGTLANTWFAIGK